MTAEEFACWVTMVSAVSTARAAWWLSKGDRGMALCAAAEGHLVVALGCVVVEAVGWPVNYSHR